MVDRSGLRQPSDIEDRSCRMAPTRPRQSAVEAGLVRSADTDALPQTEAA